MDWLVVGYAALGALSALFGCALGALAWGPGVVPGLARRITNTENRVEDIDKRITGEVKKRAQVASVESRSERRTDAELTADAAEILRGGESPSDSVTGRVRTTGVFPAPRSVR